MISLTSLKRRHWERACGRLGLQVDKKRGKGSHYRIVNPKNNKKQTLPVDCHQFISLEIYKTFLEWGFTEKEIDKALG